MTAAAKELTAAGLPVQVWDETYGKQGLVATPGGLVIGLNEDTQDDLYGGYQAHRQTVTAPIDVVAECMTDDVAEEAAFFASFGFTADSLDDPFQVRLRAEERSGVLRLHRGRASQATIRSADDQLGPPYLVQLGFQTSEPLDALAARLRRAGYQVMTMGGQVTVTDPDGETIQIHPTP